MGVNRCVCKELYFTELKKIADENNLNFEQLQERTECSTECGLCEPYVRLMLKTGDTNIKPMHPDEIQRLLEADEEVPSSND